MRGFDADGRERHWILEIHFVDRGRQIGGFYEELLTPAEQESTRLRRPTGARFYAQPTCEVLVSLAIFPSKRWTVRSACSE
jgi:hypothetical protein